MDFRLVSDYTPKGDQGSAIETLVRGVFDREQHQVLLGVTGSGKTYTMAKVIEQANRPARSEFPVRIRLQCISRDLYLSG